MFSIFVGTIKVRHNFRSILFNTNVVVIKPEVNASFNFNSGIMVLGTFNFFISRASSSTLLVPTTLVANAERKFSSKRTVAAPWNTWLMSSISRRRSEVSSPKPGRLQSPFMMTTLWRNLGI